MAKPGRPKKTKAERRDPKHILRVSFNKVERAAIDQAAQLAYPKLDADRVSARWARDILSVAAKDALAKAHGAP